MKPIPEDIDPVIEALVNDIIGKVADRWTMLILETLEEHGTLRFTQLGKAVGRISQKKLTQTVRQMEQDGLVRRTVHPVIPPHVDYTLTPYRCTAKTNSRTIPAPVIGMVRRQIK